jgi:hypothetical protein
MITPPFSGIDPATVSVQKEVHSQRRRSEHIRKASLAKDKDSVAEDKEIVAKNVEIAKMKEEIARLQFLDRIYRLCVVDVTALEEELFKERKERVEDVYRANETARERRKILALRE